mgnify:CR=1 FL=1
MLSILVEKMKAKHNYSFLGQHWSVSTVVWLGIIMLGGVVFSKTSMSALYIFESFSMALQQLKNKQITEKFL